MALREAIPYKVLNIDGPFQAEVPKMTGFSK